MGQAQGCRRSLQDCRARSVTALLHHLFPQSHLGEGGRLLTGEGTFESCCGSQHGAVVYWLGFAVLSRKERDRYPPALPNAHVALLPTKQDKGNWTENAGSTPAVCSI